MPNIKAGNRIYRDIQKMDAVQLHEIRSQLVKDALAVAQAAQKLMGKPHLVGLVSKYQAEDREITRRIAVVDNFAKQLIKKAIPDVPKEYTDIS